MSETRRGLVGTSTGIRTCLLTPRYSLLWDWTDSRLGKRKSHRGPTGSTIGSIGVARPGSLGGDRCSSVFGTISTVTRWDLGPEGLARDVGESSPCPEKGWTGGRINLQSRPTRVRGPVGRTSDCERVE